MRILADNLIGPTGEADSQEGGPERIWHLGWVDGPAVEERPAAGDRQSRNGVSPIPFNGEGSYGGGDVQEPGPKHLRFFEPEKRFGEPPAISRRPCTRDGSFRTPQFLVQRVLTFHAKEDCRANHSQFSLEIV